MPRFIEQVYTVGAWEPIHIGVAVDSETRTVKGRKVNKRCLWPFWQMSDGTLKPLDEVQGVMDDEVDEEYIDDIMKGEYGTVPSGTRLVFCQCVFVPVERIERRY